MRLIVLVALLSGLVACGGNHSPAAPSHSQAEIETPSIEGLVHIRTPDDVANARSRMIHDVFGADALPSRMPDAVSGDVMVINVPGREYAVVHYFKGTGNRLAIYHAGHSTTAMAEGRVVIDAMRRSGYDVLAIDMPKDPHERFRGQRLAVFLEPVAVALNYAMAQKTYSDVVMVGLSGGGWTTVLYTAMDRRIKRSMPVAGSLPLPLRLDPASLGDYEQLLPGLHVTYPDLYLMASDHGRSQIQVFNRNDPCCFSGSRALSYRDQLHAIAQDLGGTFDVLVVESDQHATLPAVATLAFQ